MGGSSYTPSQKENIQKYRLRTKTLPITVSLDDYAILQALKEQAGSMSMSSYIKGSLHMRGAYERASAEQQELVRNILGITEVEPRFDRRFKT